MSDHTAVLAAIADLKSDVSTKLATLQAAIAAASIDDNTDILAALADVKATVDAPAA